MTVGSGRGMIAFGFWCGDRIASWWLQRLKVACVYRCSLPPDSRLLSALPSQWINPPRDSNLSRHFGGWYNVRDLKRGSGTMSVFGGYILCRLVL